MNSQMVKDRFTGNEFDDLLLTAEQCCETDCEAQFVSDMKSRYASYAGQMYISERQQDTLERIATGVKK